MVRATSREENQRIPRQVPAALDRNDGSYIIPMVQQAKGLIELVVSINDVAMEMLVMTFTENPEARVGAQMAM